MKNVREYLQNLYQNFWMVYDAVRNVRTYDMGRRMNAEFFALLAVQLLNSLGFSALAAYTLAATSFGMPYLPGAYGWLLRFTIPAALTTLTLWAWYPLHRYSHWSWVSVTGRIDDMVIPIVPVALFVAFAIWQPFTLGRFVTLGVVYLVSAIVLREVSGRFGVKWIQHQQMQQLIDLVDGGVIVVTKDGERLGAKKAKNLLGLK